MNHKQYCIDLTRRLQRALDHDLYFMLALAEYASPADFQVLETLVGTHKHLLTDHVGDEQRPTLARLQDIDRKSSRLSKKGIRRTFKVRRVVSGGGSP